LSRFSEIYRWLLLLLLCADSKPRPPAAADLRPVSILKRARSISGESPTRTSITAAAGEVAAATAAAAAAAVAVSGAANHSSEHNTPGLSAAGAAAAGDDDMDVDAKQPHVTAALSSSPSASRTLPPLPPSLQAAAKACAACAAGSNPARGGDGVLAVQGSFAVTRSGQHYYELDDPAAALAALEHDMAALMMSLDKVGK
jgi:hypothetical protein